VKNNSQPKDQERRAFIKKSTIAGAAVAATTMAGSAIAQVSDKTTEKPVQKGYQLTSHVLDYYKSAGI
jgi:hypothetical protein